MSVSADRRAAVPRGSQRSLFERYRQLSLYWRTLIVNAVVVVAAALLLAVTPATVSSPIRTKQGLTLALGVALVLLVNAILLHRNFAALADLTGLMRRIDLLRPGQRLPASGGGEVREVITTFNEMLDRLEGERRARVHDVLMAQEQERGRISRELHDEIGQQLTGLLLELKRAESCAPPEVQNKLSHAQDTARAALDDVGQIAWRLRPGVLDDLGLARALEALARGFSERSGIPVETHLEDDLPPLEPEGEIAVYRVVQESLTNALRHSEATHVVVELGARGRSVFARIEDDGRGLAGDEPERSGIRGMRERAILADADLSIESMPGHGVSVQMTVPAR